MSESKPRRKRAASDDAKQAKAEQDKPVVEEEPTTEKKEKKKSSKRRRKELGSDAEEEPATISHREEKVEAPRSASTDKRSKRKENETVNDVFTMYICGFPSEIDIAEYVEARTDGIVDIRVARWHDSGKSRGYAHVDFDSEQHLDEAIQALNRQTIDSRFIKAERAQDKDRKLAPQDEDDKKRGTSRLFVKNLPYDINEASFRSFFLPHGPIKTVRLAVWNHTKNKKGFGYVEFEKKEDAIKCVQAHRSAPLSMEGRTLLLDYDEGRPRLGWKDENGRAWYKSYDKEKDSEKNKPRKRLVKRAPKTS